jgi:hypothetical protein
VRLRWDEIITRLSFRFNSLAIRDADYRDRLIRWTIKYSKSRNAREVYNRLQVPEWIVWLNEAAGESPQRIRKAISAMQLGGRAQQRAAEVRKVLRWEQTAQLLFDNQGR